MHDDWEMEAACLRNRKYVLIIVYMVKEVGNMRENNRERRNMQKLDEIRLRSLDFILK